MIVGIDATRNRSGGAVIHIKGILSNFDFSAHEIDHIHLWSYPELLKQIPDYDWLTKHTHKLIQKNLFFQVIWQKYIFPKELADFSCDILLSTDAGTFCCFKNNIVMSRDMLSYEPGMMERYPLLTFSRLRLYLLRYVQNSSLSRALGTVFLTNYAYDVISKQAGPLNRVKVIPHGVTESFKGICSDKTSEFKKEIVVTYVSNIAPYKNQKTILNAILKFSEKSKLKVNFIGGGNCFYYDEVVKIINSKSILKQCVTIFPKLPHSEIISILKKTDIFLYASSCENMPNTLVEGMSTGLPILCSNKGPMPDVLKDTGLYFDPDNANDLKDALEKIVKNKGLREHFSRDAMLESKKYSWKRCSHETFTYLEEIMNGDGNV